jgi:hypothetical protein
MQLIKNSLKQQQISSGINEYRLAIKRDYGNFPAGRFQRFTLL